MTIDWRRWTPTAGAMGSASLLLLAGAHVRTGAPALPPLPSPTTVHRVDIADPGAELAEPLFSPMRSAVVPSNQPMVPAPALAGVITGSGKAVALVKGTSGDTRLVHAGETIDGWTIVEITPRQITVSREGTQQVVMLEFGKLASASTGGSSSPASSVSNAGDGVAAAVRLGLPASNIPLGSPLAPSR